MRYRMLAVAAALLASSGARAQLLLTPAVDARLRYETVDQRGIAREADAITARLRTGITAAHGPLAMIVEGEATLAILARYDDGLQGSARYPLVADPQNIELARAALRYAAHGMSVTAGRQRIELADQRFVGAASFRQNDQAFDALRWQATLPAGLTADVSYAWSVRTVNGIDGRGTRQQAVSGDNVFALLGAKSPLGTLTGFTYLVDQDEAVVQGFRLASQTYGARLAGSRDVGIGRLAYALSYARQSDYHRNPNRYTAEYFLGEALVTRRALTLGGGYEVLGAADGGAFTSFQTPLASLFKFQGWADRFTVTPPDGVRDLYATGSAGWTRKGRLTGVGLTAAYHRFASDRAGRRYGDEIDILAAAKFDRATVSLRYARYRARRFATDTDKLWLTAEWTL